MTCAVDGCERVAKSRGWCQSHYVRWWTTGDVQSSRPLGRYDRRPAFDRFYSQINTMGPAFGRDRCWEWTGIKDAAGYGRLRIGGRQAPAHRWAVAWATGTEIPDGLEVDHLCKNRACVNPAHLEAVTPRENKIRSDAPMGVNARKTHCIHGHEFTVENTYRRPDGNRGCRECNRRQCRQRHQRRQLEKAGRP